MNTSRVKVGASLLAIGLRIASKLAPTTENIRVFPRVSVVPTFLLALLSVTFVVPSIHAGKTSDDPRYQIGVCDWMILKRQKLGAFARTHEIGADGLMLDMGGLGNRPTFDSKLMNPIERRKMRDEIEKYDLTVCALSMSGFYAQSFAEREGAVDVMVRDTINSMEIMGVKTAFLPLGTKVDLVQFPELRPVVVERLKEAAKLAEAANVVIGIETAYDAAGDVQLLEDVGSPNIKIFFNFANSLQKGRDLIEEIKILGKDRICMILATDEDGVWLENNDRLDMYAVKQYLDEMGWSGWLLIERSRDANTPRDVIGNFGANTRYLKKVFQGEQD
ncbi:TIM barrel protein [Pelagicoccus enzymogenes]|uniref:sugar phosphate isomerase/epimerase family protein n=1 Tax=Pelagicoccus enzymogenes TaxID=2773457 RepID=UPI00280DB947|nr:TIM barrel protein [Pelagicoccus enzymogenes]MDQ8200164.1 TIM barrel protein [Pelagicoccus enzymogenes]